MGRRDLDALAIIENPQGLQGEADKDDIVRISSGLKDYLGVVLDLLEHARLELDLLLLAINIDAEAANGGRAHLECGDASKDLDLLLKVGAALGQDSHGYLVGTVLEEQVPAVVDLVTIGLVVKAGDVVGLNTAG